MRSSRPTSGGMRTRLPSALVVKELVGWLTRVKVTRAVPRVECVKVRSQSGAYGGLGHRPGQRGLIVPRAGDPSAVRVWVLGRGYAKFAEFRF